MPSRLCWNFCLRGRAGIVLPPGCACRTFFWPRGNVMLDLFLPQVMLFVFLASRQYLIFFSLEALRDIFFIYFSFFRVQYCFSRLKLCLTPSPINYLMVPLPFPSSKGIPLLAVKSQHHKFEEMCFI